MRYTFFNGFFFKLSLVFIDSVLDIVATQIYGWYGKSAYVIIVVHKIREKYCLKRIVYVKYFQRVLYGFGKSLIKYLYVYVILSIR